MFYTVNKSQPIVYVILEELWLMSNVFYDLRIVIDWLCKKYLH
jgi:hypothetical protein